MGFGGDILYRWGNPEMYKAGGPEDRQLFFNHSTEWLPDALPGGDPNGAKLMIFDNGRDRPDMRFSTVRELELPYFQDYDGSEFYGLDTDGRFSTADIVWSYSEPVFGIIKSVMSFRQFHLRGKDKVKGEWKLLTMAWNMNRMFTLQSV